MKFLMSLVCVCCLFVSSVCFASEKVFEGKAEYILNNVETEYEAENNALKYAKRDAIEQAGTYIESVTLTENNMVTLDEVKVVAVGIARLVPNSVEKSYVVENNDGRQIVLYIKAKFVIDDSLLYKRLVIEKDKLRNEIKANELYLQAIMKENEIKEEKYRGEIRKIKDEEVRKDLEKAISIKNDYKEAILELGKWYNNKAFVEGDNNRISARNLYLKVLKIEPANSEIFKCIGDTYAPNELDIAFKKKTDNVLCNEYVNIYKAIEFYSKAIEMNPSIGEYYNCRGDMYRALGKNNLAISDYSNYIKRVSDKFSLKIAYKRRADLYYKQEDIENALSDIDKAINIKIPQKQWRAFSRKTITEENEYYLKMKCLNKMSIMDSNTNEQINKIQNDIQKYNRLIDKYDKGGYDWRVSLARRCWRYLWLYTITREDVYWNYTVQDLKNAVGIKKNYRTKNIYEMTDNERYKYFEDVRINDLVKRILEVDSSYKNDVDSILIDSIKGVGVSK